METPIISIEEIEMKVIYVRFRGSYVAFRKNARKLLNQLIDYAKKYDLIIEDWTKILIMYHDNPYITFISISSIEIIGVSIINPPI